MKNKVFLRGGSSTPDRNASTTREFTTVAAPKMLCFQVVDPLNKYLEYSWAFRNAAPVMSSGALFVVAGGNTNHKSLEWIRKKENMDKITALGFKLVTSSTVASDFGGAQILGELAPEYGNLAATGLSLTTGQFVNFPAANTTNTRKSTKIVFKRT